MKNVFFCESGPRLNETTLRLLLPPLAPAARRSKKSSNVSISNWAKKDSVGIGFESQHNKQYWLNQPYLGFGAGAHGFPRNCRTENVLSPSTYIELIQDGVKEIFPRTPATIKCQDVDIITEMQETVMMGLRLVREGITKERFNRRFGRELAEVFKEEINELCNLDLLEWTGEEKDTLRLTKNGRLLGNRVFMSFI